MESLINLIRAIAQRYFSRGALDQLWDSANLVRTCVCMYMYTTAAVCQIDISDKLLRRFWTLDVARHRNTIFSFVHPFFPLITQFFFALNRRRRRGLHRRWKVWRGYFKRIFFFFFIIIIYRVLILFREKQLDQIIQFRLINANRIVFHDIPTFASFFPTLFRT